MAEFCEVVDSRALYDSIKRFGEKGDMQGFFSRIFVEGRLHSKFFTELTEEQVRQHEEGILDEEGVVFDHLARQYPISWEEVQRRTILREEEKPLIFNYNSTIYEVYLPNVG